MSHTIILYYFLILILNVLEPFKRGVLDLFGKKEGT